MALRYTPNGTVWNALLPGSQGPQGPPGGLGFNRNWIINGDFSVNQRAFTSTGTNGTYMVDRWYCVNSAGSATVTVATVTAALAELPESSRAYLRVTTSGAPGVTDSSGIAQKIEGSASLSGGYATVSFWAKSSVANYKVGAEFVQNFGAGGSASVYTPVGSPITIGTTWARYVMAPVIVPSVAGKTLGADSRNTLLIHTSAGADMAGRTGGLVGTQIGNIDIWGVQVEEGVRATPFEHRSLGDTLWECQRYFQRWKHPPIKGVMAAAADGNRMGMPLPVTMRAKPTVTLSGPLPFYDGSTDQTLTTINVDYSTASQLEFNCTTTGTGAVGRPAFVTQFSSNANYMDLSAEL